MSTTTAETTSIRVEFRSPMLGLSPYRAFALEPIAGADGLYALRATDADVRLFVLDPRSADPGYAPVVSDDVFAEVDAADSSEVDVFVVANPSADGVHVNLRAPILIHRETGRATQTILDDQTYPIRALLGG